MSKIKKLAAAATLMASLSGVFGALGFIHGGHHDKPGQPAGFIHALFPFSTRRRPIRPSRTTLRPARPNARTPGCRRLRTFG